MKKHLPTEINLLEKIYKLYYNDFKNKQNQRDSILYVPIDVDIIAEKLGSDGEIIFGILHYHLDFKYRYQQSDRAFVHLFARIVGNDKHCINFPYMVSVLAGLQSERRKHNIATILAIISVVISLIALFISAH